MKENVGGLDRTIRIAAGVIILAAGFYYGSWWGLIGGVLLATGLMRSCGAYTLLGFSTCKTK